MSLGGPGPPHGAQGLWGPWALGPMGLGAHGLWGPWALGPMGLGAPGTRGQGANLHLQTITWHPPRVVNQHQWGIRLPKIFQNEQNTSRAKINQTKNKALGRSAPSRCSSMNYGLFIKTLGPHGAPRVPWDPQGSKFGPRPPGPNFDPRGPGVPREPWGLQGAPGL